MPSARKQKILKKRSRRGIYLLAAIVVLVTLAGVGWYIYASGQSTNDGLPSIVYAQLNTSQGQIQVELYHRSAPKTIFNFVTLAKSGFYDGLVWHRIVQGFVIQTGDPNSRNGLNNSTWGQGGSSKTVPLEIDSSLHNTVGYLGMARKGDDVNSGTSQFYINLADNTASLDGKYTVFGKVISGMVTVSAIASVPVYEPSTQPINPVYLTSVTISNSP